MLVALFTESGNVCSSRTVKFLLKSVVRLLSPDESVPLDENVPLQQLLTCTMSSMCTGRWAQEGYQKCLNPELTNLNVIQAFL